VELCDKATVETDNTTTSSILLRDYQRYRGHDMKGKYGCHADGREVYLKGVDNYFSTVYLSSSKNPHILGVSKRNPRTIRT
jgi:hypothetical protein